MLILNLNSDIGWFDDLTWFLLKIVSGNFLHLNSDANTTTTLSNPKPEQAHFKHRKLMLHGNFQSHTQCPLSVSWILMLIFFNFVVKGECSKWDISISQSRYPTSGIPEFIVQIVNTCVTGCAPSNIHVRCGWFASTRMVNPRTFKRLSYDDCLVNGGLPLKSSQSIRFTYANSFMYPLEFKSASFCWKPERERGFWELIGWKFTEMNHDLFKNLMKIS